MKSMQNKRVLLGVTGSIAAYKSADLVRRLREQGAEVRVVFPGKVLFAAPFQGYGLTAVVHHPGRVFSLYAGLEELKVGAEDVLSLGQVIGIAKDTLYFEIREENRPVDPAQWLR